MVVGTVVVVVASVSELVVRVLAIRLLVHFIVVANDIETIDACMAHVANDTTIGTDANATNDVAMSIAMATPIANATPTPTHHPRLAPTPTHHTPPTTPHMHNPMFAIVCPISPTAPTTLAPTTIIAVVSTISTPPHPIREPEFVSHRPYLSSNTNSGGGGGGDDCGGGGGWWRCR